MQANEGGDTITIATGTSLQGSTVNGNQGNDTITVNAIAAFTNSTLFGGDGNDSINAINATVGILGRGDAGNDSIRGGLGNDNLTGGDGNDDIRGGDGNDTINGDDGNDTIFANQGNDLISGGTGNDVIQAGQGDDSVNGGSGNDTLDGGTTGNDWLNGEAGDDTITGQAGADTLTGNAGVDRFNVDAGIDTLTDVGNGGADDVVISAGATANGTVTVDWIATAITTNAGLATFTSNAAGIDINLALATGANGYSIVGSTGAEILVGSAQADTITGANGADALDGGAGVDSFVQADGSSVIWTAQTGVVGNVIVAGGVFTFGNSTDVITNFAAGAGGDGINVTTANNLTTLAANAATNALTLTNNYLVRGAWNAGARTFTQANAGADALILFNAQNAAFENAGNDNFIIATGVGATLVAANFT